MFSSILRDLALYANNLILDCHPRLADILEDHDIKDIMGDACTIVPNRKVKDDNYIKTLGATAAINIGSLGSFFRHREEDFYGPNLMGKGGYIKSNPFYVAHFKDLIAKTNTDKKTTIGLSWFGGAPSTRADLRSIPLEQMIPFLVQDDIHLVNLQYNVTKADLDVFYYKTGIKIHHYTTEDDFYAWTQLANSVDLVVTVCNSMAHLCGAYNILCFCLVPMDSAWRYGLTKAKMVWYDSVNLIRQTIDDDWIDPIKTLIKKVNEYVHR